MDNIRFFAILWIIYGIIGLLGFQFIPPEYKKHDWTKKYIRLQGLGWILLGVPWMAAEFLFAFTEWLGVKVIILLVLSVPSLVYMICLERTFRKKIK